MCCAVLRARGITAWYNRGDIKRCVAQKGLPHQSALVEACGLSIPSQPPTAHQKPQKHLLELFNKPKTSIMKQQSLKNSEKCSVTDILNGHLHPEPSSAQWMTSAHRFWRPCQGFSRLVEVLKGLAVIPAAEITVFLQLEYLFLTHPKEVTAATLKTRPVAMPCVTTRKEQSPNPLAADCG